LRQSLKRTGGRLRIANQKTFGRQWRRVHLSREGAVQEAHPSIHPTGKIVWPRIIFPCIARLALIFLQQLCHHSENRFAKLKHLFQFVIVLDRPLISAIVLREIA